MTQLTSNFEWLKQFGTPGEDYLRTTVFDSAGNLYLIGSVYGLFGGTNPSYNTWITKYDTDGSDRMYGDLGNDFLDGSQKDDSLYGGKGNDTLLGGNGEDVLMGDQGSDILNGGDGNDILLGGKGDDLLTGGLGNDSLTGGAGNDKFLLSTNSGTDTITDFEVGKDLLVLGNGLAFSQLSITQENSSTLIRLSATGEILASLISFPAASE